MKPDALRAAVLAGLGPLLDTPVVLRPSASHMVGGDRGLVRMHDSLTASGAVDEVLRAIACVWASLFSDRALLYREELGLFQEELAAKKQTLQKKTRTPAAPANTSATCGPAS